MQPLSGESLIQHIHALADDIGARPAGSPQEAAARVYIQRQLHAMGYPAAEAIPFATIQTWSWSVIVPLLMGLAGSSVGRGSVARRLLGTALAAQGAYDLQQTARARVRQHRLWNLYPKYSSKTLVTRIAPTNEVRQRVVLIGHTDTNKARLSFSPMFKRTLRTNYILMGAASLLTTVATLVGWRRVQTWTSAVLGFALAVLLMDETGDFIDGANDNASAVACLLGIGAQLAETPLQHTEVWLAFTGAEEVGLLGTHALLDAYGDELRDAFFIDFEMVAAGNIHYITRHSGFSYTAAYTPDSTSLSVATRTALKHPQLKVTPREMVIMEEVKALRERGYRGICIAGADDDGWLVNWHQASDNSQHIAPQPLETAARFAWAMLEEIDALL